MTEEQQQVFTFSRDRLDYYAKDIDAQLFVAGWEASEKRERALRLDLKLEIVELKRKRLEDMTQDKMVRRRLDRIKKAAQQVFDETRSHTEFSVRHNVPAHMGLVNASLLKELFDVLEEE